MDYLNRCDFLVHIVQAVSDLRLVEEPGDEIGVGGVAIIGDEGLFFLVGRGVGVKGVVGGQGWKGGQRRGGWAGVRKAGDDR